MKKVSFKLDGVISLIMNNGHLADPLNEYSQRLKEVSSKRTKTESDHEAMARIEFEGGLYFDENGVISMPSKCIESMLIEGAKKNRLGKQFKAGVFCDKEFYKLNYRGPANVDKLYENKTFVSRELVKVTTSKIVRTRPMFPEWSLDVTVLYSPEVVTEKQITDAMVIAGQLVGLGDYRPKYGRFTVS